MTADDYYSGQVQEGLVTMFKETTEQYLQILETLKKRSSMAIHDDKNAWFRNGGHRQGGKLLLVDQADYGTQHIFFDDMAQE